MRRRNNINRTLAYADGYHPLSRNAVIRTLCIGFGDRFLSQENIPVMESRRTHTAFDVIIVGQKMATEVYDSNSTFQ